MEYVKFKNVKEEWLKDDEVKTFYEEMDLKYQIIRALIEYREKNHLSQKELAEKLGMKQQAISRFEKGEINPRIDFISKLISALNMEIVVQQKHA